MIWTERGAPGDSPPPDLALWADRLEITFFLASLLWRRGFKDFESMSLFLNPGLRNLAPLSSWPGLDEAARLLCRELEAGKKLAVWGDYDVDGITSSALVKTFLNNHGFEVLNHIPDRLSEGYGLSPEGVEKLSAQGINLLLTVDCGISDLESIARAKELGLTVIVSDHHLPGPELPPADASCAPTLQKDVPPLAGVGVAFMLMAGVGAELEKLGRARQDLRPLLDLVALGTLADVVDLNGQNRILVKNGLLLLAKAERPGLAALKSVCKFSPAASLGAGQVVFALAPRLNAAGRMGKSSVALELLLTQDRERAAALAQELEEMNNARRSEEDGIMQEAKAQAEEQVQAGRMGLVLTANHWHVGIIGIVASRIVEQFARPAVILCADGMRLKGSARSVDSFDLYRALSECSDLFLGFGGHKMAAGMSLVTENVEAFAERFDALARASLGRTPGRRILKTDGDLGLGTAMDFILLKELELMQPFGMGNAEPVFTSRPVLVTDLRVFSGLTILDLKDEETGVTVKAKAWRQAGNIPPDSRGKRIRIAYTPRIDRYNGAAEVEIRVKDWCAV